MAKDELLRLSGSTNNALETVTATGNGTGVYVGANRLCEAELRVGGPVAGTSPTLDVVIAESLTVGGTYTPIATFPQQTAAAVATEGGGDLVRRVSFITSKPYVRMQKTIGGTGGPSFASLSCHVVPPQGGVAVG